MGMFDKDKEVGTIITSLFNQREPFILWSARIAREDYPTNLGPAVQTEFVVSKMDTPGERFTATTLASAIAAKVREAEPSDFPAVVMLNKVESRYGNEALVISFLRPYGPPTEAQAPATSEQAQQPIPTGQAPVQRGDIDPATGEPLPY